MSPNLSLRPALHTHSLNRPLIIGTVTPLLRSLTKDDYMGRSPSQSDRRADRMKGQRGSTSLFSPQLAPQCYVRPQGPGLTDWLRVTAIQIHTHDKDIPGKHPRGRDGDFPDGYLPDLCCGNSQGTLRTVTRHEVTLGNDLQAILSPSYMSKIENSGRPLSEQISRVILFLEQCFQLRTFGRCPVFDCTE